MGYILSLDQGTTGSTAALIDSKSFKFISKVNFEFPQIYPSPGMVEHNLDDIWGSTQKSVEKLLTDRSIKGEEIVSIGITNQRETICPFDKDGAPLHNAIVWQDRRTSNRCQEFSEKDKTTVLQKTGLPINPYFSASKMEWLLQNCKQIQEAKRDSNLLMGTVDTFLLYKLTAGESFKTEASNASRTLLYNIHSGEWDEELLGFFNIDRSYLPQVCNSFEKFGDTKGLKFLPDGIPITGILGDQQAALFGQGGHHPGDMKCTYGTGAFLLVNTGEEAKPSNSGLLTTVAYRDMDQNFYALEGSCYIAGAAVGWLRDGLKIIKKSSDVEQLANSVTDLQQMQNLLFYPFFTGVGSPHWRDDLQAVIYGLTRDSTDAHIARATLDGIALSINDLVSAIESDLGTKIREMKVDGGAVSNNLLMSIQATISKINIIRPEVTETTAFGAALASAIGAKLLSFDGLASVYKEDRQFTPDAESSDFYRDKVVQWRDVLKSRLLR